ncbi:hypothetical protein BS78_08G024800 [Paspalum vaginatum]|nr:hypothetical protein BS78_08G024800 [Paspalum vaginatum]
MAAAHGRPGRHDAHLCVSDCSGADGLVRLVRLPTPSSSSGVGSLDAPRYRQHLDLISAAATERRVKATSFPDPIHSLPMSHPSRPDLGPQPWQTVPALSCQALRSHHVLLRRRFTSIDLHGLVSSICGFLFQRY